VSGTVGRGRMGWFHDKLSTRNFDKHLVCHTKFSKEGTFLNFQSVGNARKRKRKRLSEKEMKKNNQKWRKWGSWEEGSERLRRVALGCWGKMKRMRHTGVLKLGHVAYWTMSIDQLKKSINRISINRNKNRSIEIPLSIKIKKINNKHKNNKHGI